MTARHHDHERDDRGDDPAAGHPVSLAAAVGDPADAPVPACAYIPGITSRNRARSLPTAPDVAAPISRSSSLARSPTPPTS